MILEVGVSLALISFLMYWFSEVCSRVRYYGVAGESSFRMMIKQPN